MKRLALATFLAALCATSTLAMPTKAELSKAQPLVMELMVESMKSFNEAPKDKKAAAAVKVADLSSEFAKSAETEAAKFLLLKGAISFYVRGEAYDMAADTVNVLRAEIPDVPPAVVEEIIRKSAVKMMAKKAPRLFAQYRLAQVQVAAAKADSLSGNAWQETDNAATLTLQNGEVLEFAKCPAGTAAFNLNNFGESKQVRISRPFWIMTRPLAKRNLKTYRQYHPSWNGQDGLYDYPFGNKLLDGAKAFAFAETLTEELEDSLPKGYVVRYPTLAEWNYAVRANTRSRKDPYSEFDNLHSEAAGKIFLGDPQGKSPKNQWGLHEFSRKELLLDRCTEAEVTFGGPGNWCIRFVVWKPEYDTDPLIWTEEQNRKYVWRMFELDHPSYLNQFAAVGDAEFGEGHCRLVVGPDLVSEWKAKHGKK